MPPPESWSGCSSWCPAIPPPWPSSIRPAPPSSAGAVSLLPAARAAPGPEPASMPHAAIRTLARIFHTRPSRGAANGPGSKAREGRTTEAYSKYVEGGQPSATPETGPFPAPQQEGWEICGQGACASRVLRVRSSSRGRQTVRGAIIAYAHEVPGQDAGIGEGRRPPGGSEAGRRPLPRRHELGRELRRHAPRRRRSRRQPEALLLPRQVAVHHDVTRAAGEQRG